MRIDRILWPCIAVIYSSLVRAQDPWIEAEAMLQQGIKRSDPMAKVSDSSVIEEIGGSGVLYIPMDYYQEEQERRYSYFWSNIANDWQKTLYNLLRESSDKYNNAEATFTLARMNLWGDYNFLHNKSLAFEYSDKFNNLTNSTNSSVLFDLSVMYFTGFFGEIQIDNAKGLAYLQRSSSLGNMQAKQALAYKYFTGTNVPRDCNKALILYREIAERIRESFTDEEWYLYPPYVETYNVRIPDFTGGLLGKGLSSMGSTAMRLASERPDITSSFLTKMDGNKVWLNFGGENRGTSFTNNDDDSDDRIVDIYYTALDDYKGTYMKSRDCEKARKLLELTFEAFDAEVPIMDNLPRYFYAKCLDLLGHLYFTGEAQGKPNITLAENYLKRSNEVLETYSSISSGSNIDLGLIAQYIYKNDTAAINHYKRLENYNFVDGRNYFQLSKLSTKYPELKLGDPFILMQSAYLKGLRPAAYEFARMTESGLNDRYSCENSAYLFKTFIEANEDRMAPQLRTAYGELLNENGEVALWSYAQAAEQGYEAAQVSAACILYLLPRNFEDPPRTTSQRKLMSIAYYVRAFKQGNVDAGVVAGDIYYKMGEFSKAIQLYQSSALKFSPQALWNLGYMYEQGLGVEKDFHMAKRYYEQVLENSSKFYIAVKISVLKLRLKSWCSWAFGDRTGYDMSDNSTEQGKEKTDSWYRKLIKSYRDAFTANADLQDETPIEIQNAQNTDSEQMQQNSNGLWSRLNRLGLHLEDIMSIAFILFLFVFSIVIRIIAVRRGWNVNENNGQIRINGQHNPLNRDQNNGGFRGNFEIRVAL